jgi:hypothetical protein
LNNPVKMARIRHQLAADLETKKEKKREKKEKKSSDNKDKRIDRERDNRVTNRSRSRSRDRIEDRQKREERERYGDGERVRNSTWDRERNIEDGGHGREKNEPADRHGLPRKAWEEAERRESSSPSGAGSRQSAREREEEDQQGKKWGLQYKSGRRDRDEARAEERDIGHLGPRLDLLSQRAEREREEERARNRKIEEAQNRDKIKGLSAEDRDKKLKEMLNDAAVNDTLRLTRHRGAGGNNNNKGTAPHTATAQDLGRRESESHQSVDSVGGGKASFLQSMRKEVYSADSSGASTIEERLSRNRHYFQKGSDLDSHGFMQR